MNSFSFYAIINYTNFNGKNYIFLDEDYIYEFDDTVVYGNKIDISPSYIVDRDLSFYKTKLKINNQIIYLYRKLILIEDLKILKMFCQLSLKSRQEMCNEFLIIKQRINKLHSGGPWDNIDYPKHFMFIACLFLNMCAMEESILNYNQDIIFDLTGNINKHLNHELLLGFNDLMTCKGKYKQSLKVPKYSRI